jgi:hypothetical protein
MGFASESGYTPSSIETIMLYIMDGVNTEFGTAYTEETFIGTNFYKFFYAMAQRLQENEVKASEIFAYLQQYFNITNERIQRPVATSPGLIEALADADWTASIKPMIEADAGEVNICVDVDETDDDYADLKLEIATIIKDSVAAGVVSMGTETEAIVLSNGQSFDFKFHLPNRIETYLKLTLTLSENNQVVISTPEDVKLLLLANIAEKYSLGKNFEPQRYFTTADAPWAAEVLLEWSINAGVDWFDTTIDVDFDDLYEIDLANVTLVEV